MCGILSIYSPNAFIDETKLKNGLKTLYHRGPDHTDLWLNHDKTVGLGHTRLSIIDTSANGNQPLSNADDSLQLVVNGEFYDFEAIREDLKTKGYQFKTGSDSEIALYLYEEYGTACLEHLRGEFVFTLWDSRNKTLFAARDRVGVNPIYFAQYEGKVYFASEIKAIIAAGVPANWDTNSYLNRDFFFSDKTLFKGIHQIPPGHFLLATESGIKITKYWDFNYPLDVDIIDHPEAQTTQSLRDCLLEATETRLRADVPVGVYLSGGVDSCAILGMTAHLRDESIDAFTLSFADKDYDEADIAQKMAKQAGAKHHIFQVTQEQLADNFEQAIYHTETYSMNAHNVAKFLLSKAVRDKGFKVVLTGEGADEVFAGYSAFRGDLINQQGDSQRSEQQLAELKSLNKVSSGLLIATEKANDVDFIKRNLGYEPTWLMPLANICQRLHQLFNQTHRDKLGGSHPIKHFINQLDYTQIVGRNSVHASMYMMSKSTLPNYVLCNLGDRMEMAHSLEGRVPFLDHKVIEKVVKMGVDLKIRGTKEKYILREAVAPFIIKEVYERQKHPFLAPPSVITKGEKLHQLVQDTLRSSLMDDVPFFDQSAIIKYLDQSVNQPEAQWPAIEAILLELLSLCFLQKHFKMTV
ncbi:MAG: asparagine synthase (glutamine-hydrolyzing) [Phenylobacterium sp.]|jgi:asparagine synthase (glutamine-hydrolysing)